MNEYQKQALDFLKKTNTTIEITYLKTGKYFPDDTKERDIYQFTIKRGNTEYTANFGQSIVCSGKWLEDGRKPVHKKQLFGDYKKNKEYSVPNEYDILACLTTYDPGSFKDFCDEFGYTDPPTAYETYQAVIKEYQGVCSIWNPGEREQLAEIQ